MRILILGRPESWHVERLSEAARALGHAPLTIRYERLRAELGDERARVVVGGAEGAEPIDLGRFDAAIVRGIPPGSLEQVVFRMDALQAVESAVGVMLNSPRAIETAVDKFATTRRLQGAGLPVPRTVVTEDLEQALDAFERLGRDVLVKPIFGSEGRGIVRVEDSSQAYRVFRSLMVTGHILYLQEFVRGPGHDVRILTLGGKPIGSMVRRPPAGDFRANASRGGRCEPFTPPDAWLDLATRAAAAVGAELAGVDLMPDQSGQPLVLEVNSVPGFEHLTRVTGTDLAATIIRWLAARVADRSPGGARTPAAEP
jgi:ribosomal protein S6--L-glutamate ligase